jgi:50S ribosome-binding GTPase/SAP domain
MPTKRTILEQLQHPALIQLVDRFELEVPDRRSKLPLQAALATSRRATTLDLLGALSVAQLQRLCAALGLEGSGRKADLIARLSGRTRSGSRSGSRSKSKSRSRTQAAPRSPATAPPIDPVALFTTTPATLEQALQGCRQAARLGHAAALRALQASEHSLAVVRSRIEQTLHKVRERSRATPEVVGSLDAQLTQIVAELEGRFSAYRARLERDQERLDDFSVTLFGRTMAGKSTLMEILIRGDGASIGRGAQRTTRDVRTYTWRGLRVTDVPGVAAFEGQADEELAYAAARDADLVLFLITDDKPQPLEALHLARLKSLGKPIVGICNVQHAVDRDKELRRFRRAAAARMDPNELRPMVQQFMELASRHVPNVDVEFTPVHLRARFISDQLAFAEQADELRALSNFDALELRLIHQIIRQGTFLRSKKYIDDAVVLLLEVSERLLDFAADNASNGRILIDKQSKLNSWAARFAREGEEQIRAETAAIFASLRGQIPDLVEDHLESRELPARWQQLLASTGVEGRLEAIQRELWGRCDAKLQDLRRELELETRSVARLRAQSGLRPARVVDGQRIASWATTLGSGGLGIAAALLGSGPLGWAAAGIAGAGLLLGKLLKGRAEKLRKERSRAEQTLYQQLDEQETACREALLPWFRQRIVHERITPFRRDLSSLAAANVALADAQRSLAHALAGQRGILNRQLVDLSLTRCGAEGWIKRLRRVARVPGAETLFLGSRRAPLPAALQQSLRALLQEQILFLHDAGEDVANLRQILGTAFDPGSLRVDDKVEAAYVRLRYDSPAARSRVSLAQQLTGLHIQASAASAQTPDPRRTR